MNKLEEIRDKLLPEEGEDSYYIDLGLIKREGFDAAMTLGLSVKFAEWKDNWYRSPHNNGKFVSLNAFHNVGDLSTIKHYSYEELYQYWIDNIYKPE